MASIGVFEDVARVGGASLGSTTLFAMASAVLKVNGLLACYGSFVEF